MENEVDDFLDRHGPAILDVLDGDWRYQLRASIWLINNAPQIPAAGEESPKIWEAVKLVRKIQHERSS